MKINELQDPSNRADQLTDYFRAFLKLCQKELKLEHLPKIVWITDNSHTRQHHSFGSFNNQNHEIKVELNNRHILDVMRTLAHELVHYRQFLDGRIKPDSGETGSEIENEAHAVAGVIMRHFDRRFPNAFEFSILTEEKALPRIDKLSPKVLKSAVTELENTLLATNKRDHTYKEIDTMMRKICKKMKLTGKDLHDAFVKKHGVTPDEWIEYQEIGE
jgi:hypothetical protein